MTWYQYLRSAPKIRFFTCMNSGACVGYTNWKSDVENDSAKKQLVLINQWIGYTARRRLSSLKLTNYFINFWSWSSLRAPPESYSKLLHYIGRYQYWSQLQYLCIIVQPFQSLQINDLPIQKWSRNTITKSLFSQISTPALKNHQSNITKKIREL